MAVCSLPFQCALKCSLHRQLTRFWNRTFMQVFTLIQPYTCSLEIKRVVIIYIVHVIQSPVPVLKLQIWSPAGGREHSNFHISPNNVYWHGLEVVEDTLASTFLR